ncbi:reverse transcriptase domain-containing protein [Tanacetum coccineum]
MTEPSGGGLDDRYEREGTPPPLTKEQIEGHISAIKSIIKDYNRQNKADPIRLDFGTDNILLKEGRVARGKDVGEEDLSKPFKEILKTPLTRRIIEFAGPEYVMPANITLYDGSTDQADHLNHFSMAANSGEWPMPVWCRMFQQTLDGGARGWFESLPLNSINEHCFENLPAKVRAGLRETRTDLVGFAGEVAKPLGKIDLETRAKSTACHPIDHPLNDQVPHSKRNSNSGNPGNDNRRMQTSRRKANTRLSPVCKNQLKTLLTNNMEVFAWEPADMTGVPRRIIEHSLNVNPSLDPVCQKRRTFSPEKSKAVTNEVAEWVRAGIVRPVKYPTYISNPVLVKKCDGSWRMCIDFKILNSACPKDYYPLPSIDCKVEAVMGFKYKCFLDAYKGYHQIQMAREDEEKTAFYTEQGTYCYMKMPFGRNLEAYVDDMVIKSKDENDLLADIAETFENLKAINMKLNPKKCSFGVEEGKFLGYMVTSEGIRANPKKTKAISDLTSPKTLKEMQSLSGKLASLNRFLAKSAERALPFFNTLKNVTKENKHEYR